MSFSARAQLENMRVQVAPGSGNILGTVVHQFSPRIEFQVGQFPLNAHTTAKIYLFTSGNYCHVPSSSLEFEDYISG